MLAMFCADQGTLKMKSPISASGALLSDPTREWMVGVVVCRNHSEQNLQ